MFVVRLLHSDSLPALMSVVNLMKDTAPSKPDVSLNFKSNLIKGRLVQLDDSDGDVIAVPPGQLHW